MFKEINEDTNLLLWGTHMVKITRNGNRCEIVAHPNCTTPSHIVCRVAEYPYRCTLTLEDNSQIDADLSCEEDWGEIQEFLPADGTDLVLGWGNDADGHRRIVSVEDEFGREIPLDQFKQEVEDFIIYFEN